MIGLSSEARRDDSASLGVYTFLNDYDCRLYNIVSPRLTMLVGVAIPRFRAPAGLSTWGFR